jgi:predicted AlkP superfamily phosphohydrolase/phosphomutase
VKPPWARLAAGLAIVIAAGCGPGAPSSPKILVIGLDGATWDLLDPWMAKGELPQLRRLRDEGVASPLYSVIPPLSPPAWTTAATGVNPGSHGIYDFHRVDPDSQVAYLESARSRRVPGVWTLFEEGGLRAGVVNIPMTDPPDPLERGFMVAGMPHPDTVGYAHPPALEADLHRAGYRLDRMGGALLPGREAALEEEILDTLRRRRRAVLELGEANADLDLYWVVFTATDRIQHFFWKFMEADHPFHDPALAPRFGDSILRVYREVDAAVGELVAQAGAQAEEQGRELAVIVLSDHGFTGIHRAFRPQSFLRHPPDGKPPIEAAYSLEADATLLYVPLKGREREAVLSREEHDAICDEALARILAARDPAGGASPVLHGARREDVYSGRYVDKAPDLVFLARPPYYLINEEGDKEPFGTPRFTFNAHHAVKGVLVGWGPMFRRGRLEGRPHLSDVAPTLLYLAGLPVPGYMEGNFLEEIILPERLAARPPARTDEGPREAEPDSLDRVRSIPYLQ